MESDGILERLAVLLEVDRGGLNAGLTTAINDSRRAGLTAGDAFARGLTASLPNLGSDGLRVGQKLSDGVAMGIRQGEREVKGAVQSLTAGLSMGSVNTSGLTAGLGRVRTELSGVVNDYARFKASMSSGAALGASEALKDAAESADDLSGNLGDVTQAGVNTAATLAGLVAAAAPVNTVIGASGNSFGKLNATLGTVASSGSSVNTTMEKTSEVAGTLTTQVDAAAKAQERLNAAQRAAPPPRPVPPTPPPGTGTPPAGTPPAGTPPTPVPPVPPAPPAATVTMWGRLTSVVGTAGTVFGIATLAIGAVTGALSAIVGPINTVTDEFAKFEYGLAKISTLTDKMPGQLKTTGAAILNMSTDLGMSYEDLSAGLYDVLGAGVRGTEDMAAALKFTNDAAKLAVAGATETAVATDALTSIMNSYKLSAADTKKVSDGLFQTVKDGKISFNDLASSVGMVTAIAADAEVPLQTVLAALATMTANGVAASSSVDYLRSLIAAIINPSEKASETAKSLGIQFDAQALASKGLVGVLQDVMKATNGNKGEMGDLLGGVEAITAATSIASGNFDRMEQNLKNQAQSAGATETAYQKMAGTLQQENTKVDTNWKKLMVNLGEAFAPLKLNVMQGINEMLEGLNTFIERMNRARALGNVNGDVNRRQQDVDSLKAQIPALKTASQDMSQSPEYRAAAKSALAQATAALATAEAALATAKQAQAQVINDNAVLARNGATVAGTAAPDAAPYDAASNSGPYQSQVAMEALKRTGVRTADAVVDYCAQWVRLTLGRADAKIAPVINKLFQTDSNGDGNIEARDAAANVKAAGLMRSYSSVADLRPGDTVFYTDGGQNHVGIYIGGGMVRGNNRVTYQENGGKFDSTGRPISSGINPVGNVNIDRLGNVSGFARADDFATYAGRPPTAAKKDENGPITDAQIIKAQQLAAAYDKAKKALEANPKSAALIKAFDGADQAVKNWTDGNDSNARALAAVRAGMDGVTTAAGGYIAKQADLNKWGNEALRLIKAQELAVESGVDSQIADADRDLANFTKNSQKKAAVVAVERAAYASRKSAQQEDEGREREAGNRRAAIAEALRQGDITLAQQHLTKLEGMREADLQKAGENAGKRAAVEQRYAQRIYEGQKAVAEKIRADALRDAANGPVQLKGQAESIANGAYNAAVAKAEADRDKRLSDASIARTKEANALAARINEEARQGKIVNARLALSMLQETYAQELKAAGDNAVKKLAVEKQYASLLYNAKKEVLDREKRDADADTMNDKTLTPALRDQQLRNNFATWQDGLIKARNVANNAISDAQKVVTDQLKREDEAVKTLRGRYDSLRNALQDRAKDGKLTSQDLVDYAKNLGMVWGEAGKAGVKGRAEIVQAHDAAKAFANVAIDINAGAIQIAAEGGAYDGLVDGGRDAAAAAAKLQFTFEELRDLLPEATDEVDAFVSAVGQLEKDGLVPVGTALRLQAIADLARDARDAMTEMQAAAEAAGVTGQGDPLQNREMTPPDPATMSNLRGMMADPAGFIAAWKQMGSSDTLPKLINDTFSAENFADLGESVLRGLIDGLTGNPLWASVTEKLQAGLALALENSDVPLPVPGIVTGNERPGTPGGPDAQPSDWEANMAARGRQEVLDSLRDLDGAALADQVKFADRVKDVELFNAAMAETKRRADEAKAALDGLPALLAQLDLNALERQHDAGGMTEEGYLSQRTALQERLENARWELDKTKLTGQALENAEREHNDRLAGIRATGLADLRTHQQKTAEANAKAQQDATDKAVKEVAELLDAQDQIGDAVQALDEAMGLRKAGKYDSQISALEKLRRKFPELASSIDPLIAKYKELNSVSAQKDNMNQYADYVSQLGAAFQSVGNSLGGDLGANLSGFGKALNLVADVAKDIVAGNYLGAAIKIISALADAIGGFQKANREALEKQKEFNKGFSLINGNDYAKTFVRSRGFFADLFGGGPEVVQQVDDFGLKIAKSIESGLVSGIKSGLKTALTTGNWDDFSNTFRKSAFDGVVDGVIEAVFNKALQDILAPGIKALTDAAKTDDTADDNAAVDLFTKNVEQGERFATTFGKRIQPSLDRLRGNLGLDSDVTSTGGSLFGSTPGSSLGLARVEVTLPPNVLTGFDTLAGGATVLARAADKWESVADYIIDGIRGSLPPLSGNGGLT